MLPPSSTLKCAAAYASKEFMLGGHHAVITNLSMSGASLHSCVRAALHGRSLGPWNGESHRVMCHGNNPNPTTPPPPLSKKEGPLAWAVIQGILGYMAYQSIE